MTLELKVNYRALTDTHGPSFAEGRRISLGGQTASPRAVSPTSMAGSAPCHHHMPELFAIVESARTERTGPE